MRAEDFLIEADIASKILQDPKTTKMLAIAVKHDGSFPKQDIADLGPRPTDKEYVVLWSNILNSVLKDNAFGDLSKDGKFDQWLLRQYINHIMDFEDLSGEAGDALGAWRALSIRGMLEPQDQDFNKFSSIGQLQRALNNSDYSAAIRRIREAEMIEKHKRDKKEIVLVDNQRFRVVIPMNWGACYTFNNQTGHMSNFCTGGSSGLHWFNRYSPSGPIISVADKQNINNKNGKWQLHAPTNQLVNSMQDQRYGRSEGDVQFSQFFPGLMKEIVRAMMMKEEEIKEASKDIVPPNGYDVREAVKDIMKKFPNSYKSSSRNTATPIPQDEIEEPTQTNQPTQPTQPAQPEAPQGEQPGLWRVVVSGRGMGPIPGEVTSQQAKAYITQYARQKRLPTGRVYAMHADTRQIVRI
jgi:hypothetical protein